MPETKKYAILCSTQEQARECIEKRLHCFIYRRGKTIILPEGYTIITYEEAVEKGLLGEKEEKYKSIHDPCPYGNDDCPKCNPKKDEVKEESKIEFLKRKWIKIYDDRENYHRLVDKPDLIREFIEDLENPYRELNIDLNK